MTALADLKSRIAFEIDRTDMTAAIASAITSAVSFYKFRRFVFNETTDSFTTEANTSEYSTASAAPTTLPDDILELDTARITISTSDRYLLSPLSFKQMDDRDFTTTYTSHPIWYAWRAEALRLYPVPDGAYVVDLRYLASIDEETWASRAEALIRCRAKAELFAHVLRDMQMATSMQTLERQEFEALKREYRLKNSTGRVVPHD